MYHKISIKFSFLAFVLHTKNLKMTLDQLNQLRFTLISFRFYQFSLIFLPCFSPSSFKFPALKKNLSFLFLPFLLLSNQFSRPCRSSFDAKELLAVEILKEMEYLILIKFYSQIINKVAELEKSFNSTIDSKSIEITLSN